MYLFDDVINETYAWGKFKLVGLHYLIQLKSERMPNQKLAKKLIGTDKRLLKIVQDSETRDDFSWSREIVHNIAENK